MSNKYEVIERMLDCGITAVVRTDSPEELVNVAEAIKKGGVDVIEITMTTPGALDVVSAVAKKFGDEVLIGAGTVLDAETARAVFLAGGEFVVSPVWSPELIAMCRRYSKPCVPGAFTPTEIMAAWDAGADMVKVFPASLGGPALIKAIRGPLPQIPLVPTGGVKLDNTAEFIRAGSAMVAVGGNLVNKDLVKAKKFDEMTELARRFKEEVAKGRS
jgi:2-dehydro-3-deoxyphosphogluconate aldolase/(4S)-4-hydroxy-2-oxoglutarate aldolase